MSPRGLCAGRAAFLTASRRARCPLHKGRLRPDAFSVDLLRRHVIRRAEHHTQCIRRVAIWVINALEHLRDAKIKNTHGLLTECVLGEHDV